jgi:hypothetical protein
LVLVVAVKLLSEVVVRVGVVAVLVVRDRVLVSVTVVKVFDEV